MKTPKELFPEVTERIEYAFTCAGKEYYCFTDFGSVPCERGFQALTYFRELDMKCTREYLKAHCAAIKDILNDNKGIKITEIAKLVMQLEERLDFITELDIAYKLCTVVFFDDTENPMKFDYKYAEEKAKKFREADMGSFFLFEPIAKLMPYMRQLASDLPEYSRTLTLINEKHLESIITNLSSESRKREWFKSLISPIAGGSESKTSVS